MRYELRKFPTDRARLQFGWLKTLGNKNRDAVVSTGAVGQVPTQLNRVVTLDTVYPAAAAAVYLESAGGGR